MINGMHILYGENMIMPTCELITCIFIFAICVFFLVIMTTCLAKDFKEKCIISIIASILYIIGVICMVEAHRSYVFYATFDSSVPFVEVVKNYDIVKKINDIYVLLPKGEV